MSAKEHHAVTLTGEWYEADGFKLLASKLPREIKTTDELNESLVVVDGQLYRIAGLELFMHAPPWRQGEDAGFKLNPVGTGIPFYGDDY